MKYFISTALIATILLSLSASQALGAELNPVTQSTTLRQDTSHERLSSRPRHIAGYTIHAKLRMSERDIGEKEVSALIIFGPEGVNQGDGTWKVVEADTPFAVVINQDAWVVTVHPVI